MRDSHSPSNGSEADSVGSSARADAVADAVAARLDARFAKLESVLAERSPGFDSREGEHAKIDTAHNERRAVKVARKELKSARRDARMELMLAGRQRERELAELRAKLDAKRDAVFSEVPPPSMGATVHIISGLSTGTTATVMEVIESTQVRSVNELVAASPRPKRDIPRDELLDKERTMKIPKIMSTFLTNLHGGDKILQGLRGDPLRRDGPCKACTVVEVIRLDDEIVGVRFDTPEDGILTYIHGDSPDHSLHPDVLFEYDDVQFDQLLANLGRRSALNEPSGSDSSALSSDLWPYKVRLLGGSIAWMREVDLLPCSDVANANEATALRLAKQIRTLEASAENPGYTAKEVELWTRLCSAESSLLRKLATAAASGGVDERQALIDELTAQIDERKDMRSQVRTDFGEDHVEFDALSADISELDARRGVLIDSLPRFKELEELSSLLETALDGVKSAKRALGGGAYSTAVTDLRKGMQSAANAVLSMPTVVRGLDQLIERKKIRPSRAALQLGAIPDLLTRPDRAWTPEFAALSESLAEERSIMRF